VAAIKISARVEAAVWEELEALAADNGRTVSGVLAEAIADYVRRHRMHPEVLSHLDDSLRENKALGRLLAE
jgi:predicted transcriptional regulator